MTRLWAAIGLLLVLLGLCLGSAFLMKKYTTSTGALLEKAVASAQQEDFAVATAFCNQAKEEWDSHATVFGSLLSHDEADQVGIGLVRLLAFGKTEDMDEFLATGMELIQHVHHIRDMEFPYLRNVL